MDQPSTVAPAWAQVVSRICFGLVAIVLVRLLAGFRWDFVAVGAIALLVATLLPSLLVALGLGRPDPSNGWR